MTGKRITTGRLTLGVSQDDVQVFLIATGQKRHKDFVIVNQFLLEYLATTRKLGGTDLRVFFLLASRMNYDNEVTAKVDDLTEKLGISKQAYHRSMQKLERYGYLIRGRQLGAPWYVMINPQIICRTSPTRQSELAEVFHDRLNEVDCLDPFS